MVAIGFITEGACERIVLKSPAFQAYLKRHDIIQVGDVIDMGGKGNLGESNKRMASQVETLRVSGANWIIILRDFDNAESFAIAKQEVLQATDIITCIAVQELEAWFLADSDVLSNLFQTKFYCENPEQILKPSNELDILRQRYVNKGISDKKAFARIIINNGFTIENAAQHSNCPSATYFLTKLQTLASAN